MFLIRLTLLPGFEGKPQGRLIFGHSLVFKKVPQCYNLQLHVSAYYCYYIAVVVVVIQVVVFNRCCGVVYVFSFIFILV